MDKTTESKKTMLMTENRIFTMIQENALSVIQGSKESERLRKNLYEDTEKAITAELDSNYKYFYDKKDPIKREILDLIVHKKAIWMAIEEKYSEISKKHGAGTDNKKLVKYLEEWIELIEGFKQYNKKLLELIGAL
jgi:hypothetical protein